MEESIHIKGYLLTCRLTWKEIFIILDLLILFFEEFFKGPGA